MSKGTFLLVASSADSFELQAGKTIAAGFYLNELTVPVMAAVAAGYDFVLATPKGDKPALDERSKAASHFGNSEAALKAAIDFVEHDPRMQAPRTLRSVIEGGLDRFIGVFVPGGHPPMVDLMQDKDLSTILRHFHDRAQPTAMLCHGPVSLTAAMLDPRGFRVAMASGDEKAARKAAKGWPYAGYKMTVFSNKEEQMVEDKVIKGKLKFYAGDALTSAGAILSSNNGLFEANVVEDRELITGQNPPSDHGVAELLVKALDRRRPRSPNRLDRPCRPRNALGAPEGGAVAVRP
jgi:putative intracellular protease/amidase